MKNVLINKNLLQRISQIIADHILNTYFNVSCYEGYYLNAKLPSGLKLYCYNNFEDTDKEHAY